MFGALLDVGAKFFLAGAMDLALSQKWSKREGFFAALSKNDGTHGTFEQDLQRCMHVGRSGL